MHEAAVVFKVRHIFRIARILGRLVTLEPFGVFKACEQELDAAQHHSVAGRFISRPLQYRLERRWIKKVDIPGDTAARVRSRLSCPLQR